MDFTRGQTPVSQERYEKRHLIGSEGHAASMVQPGRRSADADASAPRTERKADRAGDAGAGAFRRVDNFQGALIQDVVVVGLHPNPNHLMSSCHAKNLRDLKPCLETFKDKSFAVRFKSAAYGKLRMLHRKSFLVNGRKTNNLTIFLRRSLGEVVATRASLAVLRLNSVPRHSVSSRT